MVSMACIDLLAHASDAVFDFVWVQCCHILEFRFQHLVRGGYQEGEHH